jgi:hypothetical protein
MPHRATVAVTLVLASLAILSLVIRPACAAERACTNVASMNANDLIMQGNKPYGFLWHGASCYSVTVVFRAAIGKPRSPPHRGRRRRPLVATSQQSS